jgi:penicillin-binding protein 2
MDDYLRGKPGQRELQFNEKGRFVGEIGSTQPTAGADVYLTLDLDIQYSVEMALRKIERGAAVVIDPNTGNILAMASVPSFDPQKFIPRIDEPDWIRYRDDKTAPLLNRAISSFAPGSTFKIPVAFAGCLNGTDSRSFHCSGSMYYGNREMKCWIKGKGMHGQIYLQQALKSSCNAFFYQYGNAAGIENIQRIADIFRLGQKSGIHLTGEVAGRVPGPKYLRQKDPRARWSSAHTANVSIGQGDTECTPLQMASVVATVASGGIYRHPRIIDRVVDIHGQIFDPERISENPPRLQNYGITEEQIEIVRLGMWEVVNDGGGTARLAKSPLTEISGKTGTAQFKRDGEPDNHAWFVGFAPYVQPKFAVCVFVQGGKSGGSVAAPIMRHIIEESLVIYKNRKDGEELEVEPQLVPEAQGSFDFTELVSFDETLSPDALGDDDDGSVVEAREAPSSPVQNSATKPFVRKPPDEAGSRMAQQPPKRKAMRGVPSSSEKSKRGLFDRFRRR